MNATKLPRVEAGPVTCPFLQPAAADWVYAVAGYCRALPQGILMIPTVEEHKTFCSSEGHTECPIYRYRQGEYDLEPWLRAGHQAWNSLHNAA